MADLPTTPAREPIKFTGKLDPGYVKVRVLPKGHKKVSMGKTAKSLSDDCDKFDGTQELFPTYHKGDEFALPARIAQAQEDNGHVEIME